MSSILWEPAAAFLSVSAAVCVCVYVCMCVCVCVCVFVCVCCLYNSQTLSQLSTLIESSVWQVSTMMCWDIHRARCTKKLVFGNLCCGFRLVCDRNLHGTSVWFTKTVAQYTISSWTELGTEPPKWTLTAREDLRPLQRWDFFWLQNAYFGLGSTPPEGNCYYSGYMNITYKIITL